MNTSKLDIVTGAFGFTGKYIAQRLLRLGREVRTLTGHPERQDPFNGQVQVAKLDFQNPAELTQNLKGASVLYNTYWIRFPHESLTFKQAVENSKILFRCAEEAGVSRIVHISIANPHLRNDLPYYKGKHEVEEYLINAKTTYAIIRPTVIFGQEGILINNIAWFLRHLPVFFIPGTGQYQLQPIFVEDLARIAVDAGQLNENKIIDAVGPETYTFYGLVNTIAEKIHSNCMILHLPPIIVLNMLKAVGFFLKDVIITPEELKGLTANLLISKAPPPGKMKLSDWLDQNSETVGNTYQSEMKRHFS